tara:strand:+ start:345 stop:653 length:309 start_codon:yes stop_codon:yes gene_type:complete
MNSVLAYMSPEELLEMIDNIYCKKIILLDVKDKLFKSKTYQLQSKRRGITLSERMEKYTDKTQTFYNKYFFSMEKYITKIFDMPKYFPDSKLGSYAISINKP